MENKTDWSGKTEAVEENFRAETREKTIMVSGMEVPYNQYLTSAGAAVDVKHSGRTQTRAVLYSISIWLIRGRIRRSRMEEQRKNRYLCWNV